ncbi:MAG TPA: biopolymer transporter ExbD, partial [Parafilimonas sp.]|nr:biopolymer transporter ExbD [Parafilimonas sp.]
MAEIVQQEHKQKAGVRKSKKASLRVDLTPMVDLVFLLISFFVFTTTLAKPTTMHLAIPDDRNNKDSSVAPVNKTLHLLLGANNNVFYYEGDSLNQLKNIGAKATDLRDVIINKKTKLRNYFGSDTGLIVLIKPTKNATYANVVNTLDEMLINNVKTYVLMDASKEEVDKIN